MSLFHIIKAKQRSTLLVVLVGIAVCALIIVAKPKETPAPFIPAARPEVSVVEVDPIVTTVVVETQGTVRPKTETQLVSQVAGQVVWVSEDFVAGGFFKAGEELLRIDPRDYQIALAQQQSTLAAAEQHLAEEKGRALQVKREWRDLGNEDANALFLRKPQLSAAKAQVDAAQASVNKALLDLERTRFTLPFNGRVRTVSADLGQYVSFGSEVGAVFSDRILEVRLPLSANQIRILGLISKRQDVQPLPVLIKTSYGNQQFQWPGKLVRTEANVDPKTRLFYAVSEVIPSETADLPDLEVGMFVEAEITSNSLSDVVVLPRTALVDSRWVYVVSENRTALQSVDVLQVTQREIRVQGLSAGQQVAVAPPGSLASGVEIAVQLITKNQAE